MSRKKVRNLVVATWIGLFMISSFEPVFIWLLIISMIALHSDEDEERSKPKKKNKDLYHQIRSDAKKYGTQMPTKPVLRSLLIKIYQNYNKSVIEYPQLQSEYRGILDEMWISLAEHIDADHWETTLSKVVSGWPKGKKSTASGIEDRLKKLDEMTKQWDEAKNEVRGGVHV